MLSFPIVIALVAQSVCQASEIVVLTQPPGAEVWLGDVMLGVTKQGGLSVLGFPPGPHTLTVRKLGYVTETRTIEVQTTGEPMSVLIALSPVEPLQGSGQPKPARVLAPVEPPHGRTKAGKQGGKSGRVLLIGLGVVGAGAAAYFATRDTNSAPAPGSISANPQTGLIAVTSFSFAAQGSADPDGDALAYSWDFGDGQMAAGQAVSHTYSTAATFNIVLTVSDGRLRSMTNTSVTAKSLTGTWSGNLGRPGVFFTFNLAQTGRALAGTYSDPINGSGSVVGSCSPPNAVELTTRVPGFRLGDWVGALDSNFDRIDGRVDWFRSGPAAFYLIRR